MLGTADATDPGMSDFAKDLLAMMTAWDWIRAAARAQFPLASEAEIEALTRGAFEHALNAGKGARS